MPAVPETRFGSGTDCRGWIIVVEIFVEVPTSEPGEHERICGQTSPSPGEARRIIADSDGINKEVLALAEA